MKREATLTVSTFTFAARARMFILIGVLIMIHPEQYKARKNTIDSVPPTLKILNVSVRCLMKKTHDGPETMILFSGTGGFQHFFVGEGTLIITLSGARFFAGTNRSVMQKHVAPLENGMYLFSYRKERLSLFSRGGRMPILGFHIVGNLNYMIFTDSHALDLRTTYIFPTCDHAY